MHAHILIADDEPLIRQALRAALVEEGFTVAAAGSGREAWESFTNERPDVMVLDLKLGDMDGLDLLRRVHDESPETKVLIVTAYGTIERAVLAMKLGGYDFLKKPFELEEMLAAVRNAVRTSTLERRVEYLDGQERRRTEKSGLIYASPAMQRVIGEIKLIAKSPVPVVLVQGESGTGKQLAARLLHDQSHRSAGPFIELNCSAIPENLVESELFGHERGAFSDARERKLGLVEIADGGTLFLDEVGDLGQAAQAKLLTFLEQQTFRRIGATALRRVDARIVAATNRDLLQMVAQRTFRQDLYYRLGAMAILLPPLRQRPEDIAPLAEHFLAEAARMFHRRWRGISRETVGVFARYGWPGNVRELRAVIHRAALLHDDEVLLPAHLPVEIVGAALRAAETPESCVSGAGVSAKAGIPTLAEMELGHIRRVLDLCGGNRTLAAQHLGITRQTLSKKLGSSADEGHDSKDDPSYAGSGSPEPAAPVWP